MKTITLETLESMQVSKGKLFESVKDTFDYSLPQDWLNDFSQYCNLHQSIKSIENAYHIILSTTVWVYPKNNYFGKPLFACTEVKKAYIDMQFYNAYHNSGGKSIAYGIQSILKEYFELTHGNNPHYRALEDFTNRLLDNPKLSENGMFCGMLWNAFHKLLNDY